MTPIQEIQLIIDDPMYFFESGIFSVFQALSGVAALVIAIAALYFWWKADSFQRQIRHVMAAWNASPIPMKRMMKRWVSITRKVRSDEPLKWRAALIDSDNMLDEIFKKVGYEGQNMEERLSNIHIDQFPSLEDAWRSHKVRKFLDEDPSYELNREVVDKAFAIYRNIFRETGLII